MRRVLTSSFLILPALFGIELALCASIVPSPARDLIARIIKGIVIDHIERPTPN